MKKIYPIFLALFGVLTVGCASDGANRPQNDPLPKQTLRVEAGRDDAGTRATVVDGATTVWEDSDRIVIFAESYIGQCDHQWLSCVELSEDRQSAFFEGDVVPPGEIDTYYAAHPASAVLTHETAGFTIPAQQTASATPQIMMCAKTGPTVKGGLRFQFKPVDALFHITLSGSATGVTRIVMEACGGEDLAGGYTYNFANGATSVSGSKSITVTTGGLSDFYISLPAVTLSKGYKLTFYDGGGQQMIRSYGYGSAKEFRKGDIANLEVSSFEPVSLTSDIAAFKSAYDIYKESGAAAANEKNGSVIYCDGAISYSTTGISSTMISEIGLLVDGVEKPATSWNRSARTFTVADMESQSWTDHTAQVYIKHNGSVIAKSAVKTVSVTGIPYVAAPPTAAGGWYDAGTKTIHGNFGFYNGSLKLGTVKASGESLVGSPSFNVPANINITVDANVKHYKWGLISTTFIVKVNGSKIIEKGGSGGTATYTLSGSGTFTPTQNKMYCESSYTASGPYVEVYWITINYR